jgi:predicted nucleic acid-binding protein
VILYFDTSALIKLVVDEEGSELAAELWELPGPVVSNVLAYPEARAALAAASRAGRLSARAHRRAVAGFEAAHGQLHTIAVDEPLARSAGELADRASLRGYDAVHLATALALGDEPLFVTWDRDLARAASRNGVAVAPSV